MPSPWLDSKERRTNDAGGSGAENGWARGDDNRAGSAARTWLTHHALALLVGKALYRVGRGTMSQVARLKGINENPLIRSRIPTIFPRASRRRRATADAAFG